jgi:hypothetical protein
MWNSDAPPPTVTRPAAFDGDIGHPPEVDHHVARLRKAFVGVTAAADCKGEIVANDPVDHGGDGPFVSADRAQRRAELSARIGCGEKIAVLWIRRSQEQHLACRYVRKRRQRRRVGQRERCNGLHGQGDAERVCWRKFLDLKRMFHGSHLLAVSPRAPDRKNLDITIDCCNDF